MKNKYLLGVALTLAIAPLQASAGLVAEFLEGAPKDRFEFTNQSSCDLSQATLTLDLSGSAAGLIFDVTGQGAGIEVFQPLEMASGTTSLATVPQVKDGDNALQFELQLLSAGSSFSFTIDVDDTQSQRGITVSNSEISGASISLNWDGTTQNASFGQTAQATITPISC